MGNTVPHKGGSGDGTRGSDRHGGRRSSSGKRRGEVPPSELLADRARQVVGESVRELQAGIQSGIKRLEEQDHPAAHLLDTLCSPYLDQSNNDRGGIGSFYSEDVSEDSRTISEDETTLTDYQRASNRKDRRSSSGKDKDAINDRKHRGHHHHSSSLSAHDERSLETGSYQSQSDGYESSTVVTAEERALRDSDKAAALSVKPALVEETAVLAGGTGSSSPLVKKPLASAFAKRCYFTKQGIGGQTQHYEGLTLTGNVVLMLAAAMKLKGCPTICDEDLRRVEQTYPNQFSRLPDELLLSSGWRRISKYCHFSNKAIPDGSPFFHSKQRLHPSGGYYFLLAAAVGMVRPIDVEPLTRDTLVLLETDYPATCDIAPDILIRDPDQWTLVDKFCFFSGGPINTDEDVYYQADFDGNPIYMLAFLSPSLTPAELYKLDADPQDPGLKSVAAVEEVESVYDLTDRDFDDLKLYHLGPCRALPPYILQPEAWTKVLPPHFLAARQTAMLRAQDYERHTNPSPQPGLHHRQQLLNSNVPYQNDSYYQQRQAQPQHQYNQYAQQNSPHPLGMSMNQQQQPMGQAPLRHSVRPMQMNDPYDDEMGPHNDMHANGAGGDGVQYYDEEDQEPFDGPTHLHSQNAQSGSGHNRVGSSGGHVMYPQHHNNPQVVDPREFARQVEEEGAFIDDTDIPIDEAIAAHAASANTRTNIFSNSNVTDHLRQPQQRMDPPDDEPPSLSKKSTDSNEHQSPPSAAYYGSEYENGEEYYGEEYYEDKDAEKYYSPSPEVSRQSVSPPPGGIEDDDDFEPEISDLIDSPDRQSPQQRTNRPSVMPPVSPRSSNGGESFPQTTAMREAQDMLASRRNSRARRPHSSGNYNAGGTSVNPISTKLDDPADDNDNPTSMTSPNTDSESGTWESSSDFTGSDVWSDNGSNVDDRRNTRRALILQMAKARMKSNKLASPGGNNQPIGAGNNMMGMEMSNRHHQQEEEKKADGPGERDVDLDLTVDLD